VRSASAIHHKIRQAQYRHVKRALRARFPRGEDWDKGEVAQVKAEFREFFGKAPLHEIARDCPDVAALLWVSGSRQENLVPGGTLVGKMGGVLLWADTPEGADRAREMIDLLADASKSSDEEDASLPDNGAGVPTAPRQSWWQRIFR